MKCEYCGKEFTGRKKKYCSRECCYNADVDNKRMKYVWISDRAEKCLLCGEKLGKGKYKFCSDECARKHYNIQTGQISHSEILKKECVICGKEFQTWKNRQICCSAECSQKNQNKKDKQKEREKNRIKYLKKHPNARNKEKIHKEHLEREKAKETEREIKRKERERKKAERDAIKKAKKQAERQAKRYEAEHECVVCGCVFVAHYSTKKYCSKTCERKVHRGKSRYKGITIDKDITLQKLAKRDCNCCQLCGLPVDWNDKIRTDKTIVCGGMYPSIDHIIPVSLGGMHSWGNVQLAHKSCNSQKSNKIVS